MKKVKSRLYKEISGQFENEHTTIGLLCEKLIKKANSVESAYKEGNPDKTIDKLSDIIWYVTRISAKHNVSIEELMARNLIKLESMLLNGKKLTRE